MNRTTFSTFTIGCLMLTSAMTSVAVAQSDTVAKPNAFLMKLVQTTREQTVANIMRQFRQYAGDDSVLEENETEKFDAQYSAMNRANSMRRLMQLDLDGDGSISKEELKPKKNLLYPSTSTYASRLNKRYEKLDTNNDGAIEIMEAYKVLVQKPDTLLNSSASLRRNKNLNVSNYLDLVPKGQPRRLTADALEKISRDAFAYFDKNGDGVLRGEEQTTWQTERRKARRSRYSSLSSNLFNQITPGTCSMPKPGARDVVVLASFNRSNRESNISLHNKSARTGVFTLNIEKGDKPIYAIVHTSKPTIIKLTGDVKRVSHLVNVTAQSGGVYDFDKTKVSFDSANDCFGSFLRNTSAGAELAQSVVKGIIGRRVDRTVSAYRMDRLSLPSTRIETCTPSYEEQDAQAYQQICGMPSWFKPGDTATHAAIKRHHPAGAEILQNDKLYTLGKTYVSQTYPAYMGMMKYINDGLAEEMSGGGYYIKKAIPDYPGGFVGRLKTRFLFAKGVTPPKGTAGLSCIETEDKTVEINRLNETFCRLFNR